MKRRKFNGKRRTFVLLLLVLILCIGIGYALLNATLTINGTAKINDNTWDIHFDNIVIDSNSVELSTGDSAATINPNNTTEVTYIVTLINPGDFYEFTVDVENEGTIDGMIESVISKMNGVEITTLPNYLNYTVSYSDDKEIAENQLLGAGESETFRVKIEYKRDINISDLPSSVQTYTFSFSVTYMQADENAIRVLHPVSFLEDSWETIIAVVRSGDTSAYMAGEFKSITLGDGLGTYTIRILNNSTPAACATTGFSQTACGFVLGFNSSLNSLHRMNPSGTNIGQGNIGGWPESEMRTYVNSTVYNALPSPLKEAVIDTFVVSGHGTGDSNNHTSTDKLYLLSAHEVYYDNDGNLYNGINLMDTSYDNTRQLDYYGDAGVTSSNISYATKKWNGNNATWWLRSSYYSQNSYFLVVDSMGYCSAYPAQIEYGVSPAFRIG